MDNTEQKYTNATHKEIMKTIANMPISNVYIVDKHGQKQFINQSSLPKKFKVVGGSSQIPESFKIIEKYDNSPHVNHEQFQVLGNNSHGSVNNLSGEFRIIGANNNNNKKNKSKNTKTNKLQNVPFTRKSTKPINPSPLSTSITSFDIRNRKQLPKYSKKKKQRKGLHRL
jgi:hypothetical protein